MPHPQLLSFCLQIIDKAMELDIFELLYLEKKPVTAEDLGKKNKYQPDCLARLLNCLTALKLVDKTRQGDKGVSFLTKAFKRHFSLQAC